MSKIVKIVKKYQKLSKLSKIVKIFKIVKIVKKCQNCPKLSKLSKSSTFSKIVKIVNIFQNCPKLSKKVSLVTFWHSMICHMFQNQKVAHWLNHSVSEWVTMPSIELSTAKKIQESHFWKFNYAQNSDSKHMWKGKTRHLERFIVVHFYFYWIWSTCFPFYLLFFFSSCSVFKHSWFLCKQFSILSFFLSKSSRFICKSSCFLCALLCFISRSFWILSKASCTFSKIFCFPCSSSKPESTEVWIPYGRWNHIPYLSCNTSKEILLIVTGLTSNTRLRQRTILGSGRRNYYRCVSWEAESGLGGDIDLTSPNICSLWNNCWKWAKLPKSGKLDKLKNNYNFLKIVLIVVNFCSHIVKFDFGLRNNFLEFAPSFILFRQVILCFWDKFVTKIGKKVADFNITFQK